MTESFLFWVVVSAVLALIALLVGSVIAINRMLGDGNDRNQ